LSFILYLARYPWSSDDIGCFEILLVCVKSLSK
jgi:hypothetical protein